MSHVWTVHITNPLKFSCLISSILDNSLSPLEMQSTRGPSSKAHWLLLCDTMYISTFQVESPLHLQFLLPEYPIFQVIWVLLEWMRFTIMTWAARWDLRKISGRNTRIFPTLGEYDELLHFYYIVKEVINPLLKDFLELKGSWCKGNRFKNH